MTIRAKLYAAIVLTVLGPLATTAVALQGMSQMGDRFDEVHQRAEHEALARELKFLVTDVNGWQTAYGYAGGDLRGPVRGARRGAPRGARPRERDAHRRARAAAAAPARSASSTRSWSSTRWPVRKLQAGQTEEVRDIFLGPELERFEAMAATAEELAAYEADQAAATETAFDEARDDARRRLIAVALGAGVVVILLLVTANDIARMALEGERRTPSDRARAPARPAVVTRDVLLTLSLLLGAALAARFVASLIRVPEILVLVLFGALLGPSAARRGRRAARLDRRTAAVHPRRLADPLLRRAQPLARRAAARLGRARDARRPGGAADRRSIVGVVAHVAFDLSWTAALLMGAVLAPTDPAILIPLFVRSRLRPKVAQTVVAESAFNDPTGAVLALALAGVLLSGDASLAAPAEEFVVDLAISTVLGIVAGVLLAATISSHRAGIWRESSAAAVLAVVTIGYFSLDSAGGSGYLGAFLAGLIVGNMERLGLAMHSEHERELRQFAFSTADLITLFVFVVLGANIPFDTLGEYFLPALAVLAALLLVARPLTVLACTLPDRRAGWTRPEVAFLCWTRETGVVPAALVGVLAGLGVPDVDVYAAVVALAIVMTLVLQALPAAWLAGRLGLLDGEHPAEGRAPRRRRADRAAARAARRASGSATSGPGRCCAARRSRSPASAASAPTCPTASAGPARRAGAPTTRRGSRARTTRRSGAPSFASASSRSATGSSCRRSRSSSSPPGTSSASSSCSRSR